MYLASFTGLLKTILIIVMVYFGIKFLFKLFKPMILKYIMKKMGEKVGKSFQQGFRPPNQSNKREPEIQHQPKTSRKNKKPVGEYIEYEEID
ncbi:DUF4834 family protein [Mesonia ostreae]|uniref:DUF4834 family protein n=1 Tax=Mesonia ostreae TaxID=861110 RepID=A0ABU2KK25_9FLAO|nr:DUF4834 family protein [Mesonia ostreae]MDT0295072.1 DUF4834 family protein [Mesonia ostreae]